MQDELRSASTIWLVAVVIDDLIGASQRRYLSERAMRYVLACVQLRSGLKLIDDDCLRMRVK